MQILLLLLLLLPLLLLFKDYIEIFYSFGRNFIVSADFYLHTGFSQYSDIYLYLNNFRFTLLVFLFFDFITDTSFEDFC